MSHSFLLQSLHPSYPPFYTPFLTNSLTWLYSFWFIHLNLFPLVTSARLIKIDSDRIEKWARLEMKVESFLDVRVSIPPSPRCPLPTHFQPNSSCCFTLLWCRMVSCAHTLHTETETLSPFFLPPRNTSHPGYLDFVHTTLSWIKEDALITFFLPSTPSMFTYAADRRTDEWSWFDQEAFVAKQHPYTSH